MEDKRNFKGVWIPKEVWLDDSLTITEKCLLVEIDSLDHSKEGGQGCFKGNEALGQFLNLSKKRVEAMITDLKKRKYVEQIAFDGKRRFLRVLISEDAASSHPRVQPPHIQGHSNTESNTKPLFIKGWHQQIKEDNPKMLKNMPQTIDSKPITEDEAKFICQATAYYNANRRNGLWMILPDRKGKDAPESNRNADSKACKEMVRRLRDGWTMEKIDNAITNMFDSEYHQKSHFMYLSLEFCHRQDKLEMYEIAADAA